VNPRFLSGLFPSAAQAHAAAEVLEGRGAVLLAMEMDAGSTLERLRRSRTGSDWTSIIVSAASVLCSLPRPIVCRSRLCVSASSAQWSGINGSSTPACQAAECSHCVQTIAVEEAARAVLCKSKHPGGRARCSQYRRPHTLSGRASVMKNLNLPEGYSINYIDSNMIDAM